ncbi:hypothetical protein ABZU32_35830 [Sphaerisporangium sp. NPDC005288]|uniref:hypothetical protein n=1 Tax=Sphaerisporangium sp. NPDC005288 TaxID=3155114 RepID=UPI0033AD13E3
MTSETPPVPPSSLADRVILTVLTTFFGVGMTALGALYALGIFHADLAGRILTSATGLLAGLPVLGSVVNHAVQRKWLDVPEPRTVPDTDERLLTWGD